MATKSRPKTKFPSSESVSLANREKNDSDNRHTRFPGGVGLQRLSISEKTERSITTLSKREEAVKTISRIPLEVNPPDSTPTRPPPELKTKTTQRAQTPVLQAKSPWDTYKSLRPLQRGGEVTAACTRIDPIKMVAIKKLSPDDFKQFRSCQHKNLLAIIEAYQFEGQIFAITNYTATSLVHIIAIPLQLEELHVSATCQQVFQGMQYLSRFGIAHEKLDSSKVLFSWDGCAKIAHFGNCQSTELALARSVGIIAIEMMQNGISPITEKLVLKDPSRWSPEASNFLDIVSWATLKEIRDHKFLKYVTPTVMIPFVEYARWETVESHYLQIDSNE